MARIAGIAAWSVVVLTAAAAMAATADRTVTPAVRMQPGDDPRWSAPGWDDAAWPQVQPDAVPLERGPLWLRWRIEVDTSAARERARGLPHLADWRPFGLDAVGDSLAFSSVFPFELYWDGRRLQQSGVVGRDRASEVPGPVEHLIRVPDELLTAGTHVVAMRLSTHHFATRPRRAELPLALASYAERLVDRTWRPVLPLVGMACALFLVALCAVMLEFAEERRPLWLSIALCSALAVYCGLIGLRATFDLGYEQYIRMLAASSALMAVIAILVPWLVAEKYAVPQRGIWLAVVAGAVAVESGLVPMPVRDLWLSRTMLLATLALAGWAAGRRLPCAWAVALAACLRLVVITPRESVFAEPAAFVIAGALVLFVCRTLAAQARANRRRARLATLTAARLELELLKKYIQPHFLVNTLASIVEVVEREPRTAVTLIEALASEFRLLARVSGGTLIRLGQEIQLCRSHLRVMGIRRGQRYTFETRGLDEAALVPPGLFHTLVEGGLTHQSARERGIRFVLAAEYASGSVRYTLLVQGGAVRPAEPTGEGTGLRYVRARLEESYAERWSLSAGPVAEGWRTVIEIRPPKPKEAHESAHRGGRAIARAAAGTFLSGDPFRPPGDVAGGDAIPGGQRAD